MTRRLGDEQNERGVGLELARVRGRVTRLERRPAQPGPAVYEWKWTADTQEVTADFPSPVTIVATRSIAGLKLVDATAWVTSDPEDGPLIVYVYLQTDSFTGVIAVLQIDEDGHLSDGSEGTVFLDDEAMPTLSVGNEVSVEVVTPSEDARGLGIELVFQ